MSALRNIRLLTRYSAWANSLLHLSLGELPAAELTKPRQIVFGNLIRTLNHVYTIDLVWQAHLVGRAHGFTTRTLHHTTYHRGHIAATMYQIPAPPLTTDLPVFQRNAALQTERGPCGPS